ncbi:MAG: hypothetical protein GVY12_02125 [Bacteroidetes bacterium]|jgi:hypothetical protein|nr:hypothetical protein [Bacteroidota bacterium]
MIELVDQTPTGCARGPSTSCANERGSSQAPIFVVGANRSGTTLLRLLLNAHSRIAIPEELAYFNQRLAGVPLSTWRAPELSHDEYALFVRGFIAQRAAAFAPLVADELEAQILESGIIDLRHPYRTALAAWARAQGKKRWGEKTPGNLFYADVILEMFPEARFIYIARDPRAGVASMKRAPMFADDVVINALNRRKYGTSGLTLLERAVPVAQRTTIRYEDLVTHPEDTVQALCGFLDEAYEPEMLRFYEASRQFMTARAADGFNRAATTPIRPQKVDAWRMELAPEDVALIEHLCAEEMVRFGYEPSADAAPGWPQRLDLATKRAYYRLQHWRHPHAPQYLLKHRVFDRSRRRMERLRRRLWSRQEREVQAS